MQIKTAYTVDWKNEIDFSEHFNICIYLYYWNYTLESCNGLVISIAFLFLDGHLVVEEEKDWSLIAVLLSVAFFLT